MVFTPGMRLADRYRLSARIGLGGMSEVWRAADELLGRPVAIKALASPLVSDPALRAGIRREAMAAARLTHPHVTHVYDYGEVTVAGDAPVPYLVMELVEGENLAQRLSRGPLPWREAVRVAAQVAAGLAAGHRMGVVHRDIKPGNVMLTATGAKILDFGIASLAGAHAEAAPGRLIGTPAYAAPERLHDAAGAAGPATDVYALGAFLYECLSGRKAIPAGSWEEVAAAHRRGFRPAPLEVPGMPAEVGALCLACLAPEPAARPRMDDVAARLAVVAGLAEPGTGHGRDDQTVVADAPAAHPPTLIDRSLSPATGAAASSGRIVGSAAVVHRPAVPESDEIPPTRRPPRLRLAVAAGVVIAAGLILTLIASTFRATPASTSAGDPPPPTVTAPESPAPQTSAPRPTPTNGPEIVAELDRLLSEAAATGLIDENAAKKLRDRLNDVEKELDKRRPSPGKLRKKIAELHKEIQKRREKGEINRPLAEALESILTPLIGNGGGDDHDY